MCLIKKQNELIADWRLLIDMKISAELNFPADYSGNASDKYVKERIASLIAEKITSELLKYDVIEFKYVFPKYWDKYYTVKGTVDFYCEK